MRRWIWVGLLALGSCGFAPEPITGCAGTSTLEPDCRFQNPEDLVALPSRSGLIVSQMGAADGSSTGSMALYLLVDGSIRNLFPVAAPEVDRSWGDPGCEAPAPELFAPHGIDLVRRLDDDWMLLVINHGGRESVEFFQPTLSAGQPALTWRGCVLAPEGDTFNDLVGRPDGGFYVSRALPAEGAMRATLLGALFGASTGFVYEWSAQSGFREVSGTAGAMPNGLALSADERYLFVNMYLEESVRRVDLASGEVLATAVQGNPDNASWSADGRLLLALNSAPLTTLMGCTGMLSGNCPARFEVVALHPEDLATETLLSHDGPPIGAVSVAVQLDDALYLGTFAGDRIVRFGE